jgi:hypothetical protein
LVVLGAVAVRKAAGRRQNRRLPKFFTEVREVTKRRETGRRNGEIRIMIKDYEQDGDGIYIPPGSRKPVRTPIFIGDFAFQSRKPIANIE